MNLRSWLFATASLLAALPVAAVEVRFSHTYGEIVDRGDVSAQVSSTDYSPLECAVSYARDGNRITLTTRKLPRDATGEGVCATSASVVLGVLAAGTYDVTARVSSADGAALESVTTPLEVLPIAGRCNPNPAMSPSLYGIPKGRSPAEFVARLKSDPVFAAALGNPSVHMEVHYGFEDYVFFDYPPLDDIPPAMDRVTKAGVMDTLYRNGWACFSPAPLDVVSDFVEFYNATLDHYFYTGNAGEIAAIDADKVGPGWARTGKGFRAVTTPGCPDTSGQTVVYRFNGIPGAGPNSHFFTRDRAECSLVDKSARWSLEGVPFVASAPKADGTCGQLTSVYPAQKRVPLYRVWRPFGDSNHRFTTDRAVVGEMVAQGWVDEGAAMCVLPPS